MATSSISGLASGLDTATLVDQFMQLEAAPQTRLKAKVSSEQSLVTTLQTLNTKVALLASKAEALAKPSAWSPLTATSSNAAVSVTAGTSAGPASLSVTVTSVARSHQLGFAQAHALTDQVTGASTSVRLDRFDGSPVDLATDGTLSGLARAINDPANATGLAASLVKVADGSYQLLVESTATGAAQDFTLTGSDGSALLGGATVRAGSDASIDLGAGIVVTSTTNTFTDVLPGVTLTLGAAATTGTTSSVALARDTSKLATSVKDLVDTVNSLLADIDAQTSYDSATKKSGALAGDATARSLRSALLNAVYPSDGTSLASLGIQVSRTGTLTFDQSAFTQAYAADPAGVAERFSTAGDGFAARVATVAKGASNSTTGTLTAAITGRRTGIERLQDGIEAWDTRLELRRTTLQRQFTALETALGQMSSQSSWLAGQISSLPSSSS
ncbi:flagellar filament capping protein FliD [Nocardioides sp. P86]|uniref:flagellar filament capping protein FliD n=1 Tax=Nocardioides sp. P86 TaxID=2939569 RepID=UPI00203C1477|nr:flagellar filament capping protein FliD [Nocardioides sp. P86]MCM3514788.1 flagellar filament capping protein FliD [Nocardioides sp. P86]